MKKTLFITGVGRSGTTLLQSMLSAHSAISIPPETHFIKNYVVPELKGSKFSINESNSLLEAISSDKLIQPSESDLNALSYEFKNLKDSKFITPLAYCTLFKGDDNTKYIGDKDPMNINYLKIIKKAFPSSKVIHIIRDPRDVISSRMKSDWGKRNSLIWHTSEYNYSINKGRIEGEKLFGKNYIEVKYEELIINPEKELSELCKFLNISFEEDMLEHHLKASSIIRKEELKWKENVLKPIDDSKIGQWKTSLSDFQIQLIESVLRKTMSDFDYQIQKDIKIKTNIIYRIRATFIFWLFKMKFGL